MNKQNVLSLPGLLLFLQDVAIVTEFYMIPSYISALNGMINETIVNI